MLSRRPRRSAAARDCRSSSGDELMVMLGAMMTRMRPSARPCQASANAIGLAELRLAERRVVAVAVVAQAVHLDVERHHAHEAPDPEPLDEGGVDVGVLLHLEHGRHAAPQELGVGERPDRQTLLPRDDGRHGEVLAGHAAQAGILGPAPEERVADVGVAAHEARDHDLAPAIENSGRRRMPADDFGAGSDVDDARALDVHRARVEDALVGVHRDHGRVADEDAHGRLVGLLPGGACVEDQRWLAGTRANGTPGRTLAGGYPAALWRA